MKIFYEIEMLSDTSFKPRSAGGLGLDFCPGGVVLGHVAARRGYEAAEAKGLAWTIFHSGEVRFSDARVVDQRSGRPAVVWPLSFHAPKGALADDLGTMCWADAAADQAIPQGAHDRHGVQASLDGERLKVGTEVELKTKVSFETQRAEEGNLFQVQALPAGTRLRGVVEASGPRAAEALEVVHQHLFGRATLGWSKRTEYGRARIEECAGWAWPDTPRPTRAGEVVFLLRSEACLLSAATGQPTLTPEPAHFGLNAGAVLDATRTFLRTVRWTPFNTHRGRPEVERIALSAGSVITFTGVTTPKAAIDAYVGEGVGFGRAEGLGAVWRDPPLLKDWVTWRKPKASQAKGAEHYGIMPADPLGGWLGPRWDAAKLDDEVWSGHLAVLDSLKRVRGLPPAQWRRVAQEARKHVGAQAEYLQDALLSADGVCRRGVARHRWERSGGVKGLEAVFAGKTAKDAVWLPRALVLAAERMARVAAQEVDG